MAYSNFTLQKALKDFGLKQKIDNLFSQIKEIEPSDWLKKSLDNSKNFPINSEKARSELLITPIFFEVKTNNQDKITVFSGESLDVDSNLDLNGECDFILVKDKTVFIKSPIFGLVEAKKENIPGGYGQCVAQMIGANLLNQKEGNNIKNIYGCVTTGTEWQFMKLENNTVWIDEKRYYIDRPERILGILQAIVDEYL